MVSITHCLMPKIMETAIPQHRQSGCKASRCQVLGPRRPWLLQSRHANMPQVRNHVSGPSTVLSRLRAESVRNPTSPSTASVADGRQDDARDRTCSWHVPCAVAPFDTTPHTNPIRRDVHRVANVKHPAAEPSAQSYFESASAPSVLSTSSSFTKPHGTPTDQQNDGRRRDAWHCTNCPACAWIAGCARCVNSTRASRGDPQHNHVGRCHAGHRTDVCAATHCPTLRTPSTHTARTTSCTVRPATTGSVRFTTHGATHFPQLVAAQCAAPPSTR